ncbi:Uncharacterised protein [Mycobacteroides abscessus subsp. abscessus]|nr:Uncharacterised protein [Mycobacteroides abscessus subsp. abscessus]
MAGEVVAQLAMPVAERLLEELPGHRRIDAVGDPGAPVADGVEAVFVPPVPDQTRWQRTQSIPAQFVDEPCRRRVVGGIVLRAPAQSAGQAEHGAPVGQRRGFGDNAHGLPRRQQPVDGPRPRMPGEHVVARRVDHTAVLDSHQTSESNRSQWDSEPTGRRMGLISWPACN